MDSIDRNAQPQTVFYRSWANGSLAVLFCALALGGCVVAPLGHDGRPVAIYPIPPSPAVTGAATTPVGPASLSARLYPANDAAAQWGVLNASVTNYLNGRGEFQLQFAGETLTGEATRNPGDNRRGVANAYGARGTYMNCQYQMNSPTLGTGSCSMSNGSRYNLHIGG